MFGTVSYYSTYYKVFHDFRYGFCNNTSYFFGSTSVSVLEKSTYNELQTSDMFI